MIGFLARQVFGKILGNDELKKRVFAELRKQAAGTSTKIDDEAIDALEVVWDVAVPILLGSV